MLVIATPRTEEEVLAPVGDLATTTDVMQNVREFAEQCVDHLCGCNCAC